MHGCWSCRLAVGLGLFAACASCTGFFGFDDLRLGPRDSGSLPLDANAAACIHRLPPGPPGIVDAGGRLDLTFAATYTDEGFGSFDDAGRPRYESLGFDLDSRCTSAGEAPSCIEPPWAQGVSHTDGEGGIDNALGVSLAMVPGAAFAAAKASADMGHNMLLRIRDYSGDSDDDQVDVSLYLGLYVVGRGRPMSDGEDIWIVHPALLGAGDGGMPDIDRPKFHDPAAYVTGGLLVVHLADAFGGPGKTFAPDYMDHYVRVVLTARLVSNAGLWELDDGNWGGRQPIRDALSSMAYNPSRSRPSVPNCQSPMEYDSLKASLCAIVDLSSGPDDPGSVCDAISFGQSFGAIQAHLGGFDSTLHPSATCAPGIDPANDTCDRCATPSPAADAGCE